MSTFAHDVTHGIHVVTVEELRHQNPSRETLLCHNYSHLEEHDSSVLSSVVESQCHDVTRCFASDFFHESSSPKPLKITLGSFRIFPENSRRYSQVKVHHQRQILPPVQLVWCGGKFLIEDFFHLPPVPLCTLSCEFSKKFETAIMV
jgi:hypothetical protein